MRSLVPAIRAADFGQVWIGGDHDRVAVVAPGDTHGAPPNPGATVPLYPVKESPAT